MGYEVVLFWFVFGRTMAVEKVRTERLGENEKGSCNVRKFKVATSFQVLFIPLSAHSSLILFHISPFSPCLTLPAHLSMLPSTFSVLI